MAAGTATVSTVVETSYTGFDELAIQITLNIPFNGGSGVERWAAWLRAALPCPALRASLLLMYQLGVHKRRSGTGQHAASQLAQQWEGCGNLLPLRSFPFPQKLPSTKST